MLNHWDYGSVLWNPAVLLKHVKNRELNISFFLSEISFTLRITLHIGKHVKGLRPCSEISLVGLVLHHMTSRALFYFSLLHRVYFQYILAAYSCDCSHWLAEFGFSMLNPKSCIFKLCTVSFYSLQFFVVVHFLRNVLFQCEICINVCVVAYFGL